MANHKSRTPNEHSAIEKITAIAVEVLEGAVPMQRDYCAQPAESPPCTLGYEARSAIAVYSSKVMREVFKMDYEIRETKGRVEELTSENDSSRVMIENLNEQVSAKNTTIEELEAKIETLSTSEKTKLRVA